jgi:hypothetical protein
MADTAKTFTTGEFSEKTGIPVSRLTQMLRQGKLGGEKRSGKWAIYASELDNNTVLMKTTRRRSAHDPGADVDDTPAASDQAYDVRTFAQMTYLTENGVRRWLKMGRLSGRIDSDGQQVVDASNLDRPELRHLIRK